jgi:hypothetical protein
MDCIFSASQIIENIENLTSPHILNSLILKKPLTLWTIMLSKGIPTHLITIIQKIYMKNIIRVNAGKGISEDSRVITQGVRQGCPLSLVLFNLYLDKVIRIWLQELRTSKYFKELIFNTLLFADDQFIISDTEDNLQKAAYLIHNISKEYN